MESRDSAEYVLDKKRRSITPHRLQDYHIVAAMEQYAANEAKDFWMWCFVNGDKVTGYYSIQDRIEKMWIGFQAAKELDNQPIKTK